MSDQEAYLRFKAEKGLEEKGILGEEYRERLDYEYKVVCRMGFAGYYLVVADYVNYARRQLIPVGPGRGSGAGSLIAYLVGITDVDPIAHGLMFERFLNPGRNSMPDFDVDFGMRRRHEVIDYLFSKYGMENVCLIGTVLTMKSKLAIKDVARTMGIEHSDATRYSSYVPDEARGGQGAHAVTLSDCLNPTEEFKNAHPEMAKFSNAYNQDKRFHDVVNAASGIEGIPKTFGTGAAGVIISDEALSGLIPLFRAKGSGMPASQWDKDQVEYAGFVKFDILGLRTLDVVHDAIENIYRRTEKRITWAEIDDTDPATYDMLCGGDTFGVFQLGDRGISDFTQAFKPRSVEDISIISALYRPGPLDNGMVKAILDVRKGKQKPEYEIKVVAEILEETSGVLTYQEQVLEISRKMAGFTLSGADLLRRAIGKKKPEEMAQQKGAFIEGSIERGHRKGAAEEMFGVIERFADYCFNKAHSYAYSVLSFQTAYLKCHFPADFYAAELTSYEGKVEKMLPCIADAKRNNVCLLPPDVNLSEDQFTSTDNTTVRFGLTGVKAMGQAAILNILDTRKKGKYTSLVDFCRRVSPRSTRANNIEALAASGAFHELEKSKNLNRAEMIAYAEAVVKAVKKEHASKRKNQTNFFNALYGEGGGVKVHIPSISSDPLEELELERNALGIYVTGSPLDEYELIRQKSHVDDIAAFADSPGMEGLYVTVVARVSDVVQKQGKKGPYAFLQLTDNSGTVPAKVWSNVFYEVAPRLVDGTCVVARGRISYYKSVEITIDSMVLAEREVTRLLGRAVVDELDSTNLNKILSLGPGKVPLDLEVANGGIRFRLGLYEIKPGQFKSR